MLYKFIVISMLLTASLGLIGCGKKAPPSAPSDVENTYPGQYPQNVEL